MKCTYCGRQTPGDPARCPYCGGERHSAGNTEFFEQAAKSELRLRDLFTDTFKKHPSGTGAKLFLAGTPETTPSPSRMLRDWNKPWLYMRVFAVGLIFAFLNYYMAVYLHHRLGVYLLFSLCALIIPLSILTFYWEMNIPRDIPIYRVAFIFLIGGLLSVIFAILLPSVDGPAYLAPLTEEPAKVIALAIFIVQLDNKHIFGGMLIGAAVGAGFSAFENIYYVMSIGNMDTLIVRSVLSIGGHVTWAAIEGGALALVKGSGKLQPKHFADPRFLVYLAITMGLHCIWNTEVSLVKLPVFSDLKYILLCAAAILVSFHLILLALRQVLSVSGAPQIRRAVPSLISTAGPLKGMMIPLDRPVTIGRDPAVCNLVFPAGTPGVSRRHCTVERRADGVYLIDHGSTSGTFLNSNTRLPPNRWILINGTVFIGSPAIRFTVR